MLRHPADGSQWRTIDREFPDFADDARNLRPEGSISKGYGTEEVIEFCVDFIPGLKSIGVPESRHEGRLSGKGTIFFRASAAVVAAASCRSSSSQRRLCISSLSRSATLGRLCSSWRLCLSNASMVAASAASSHSSISASCGSTSSAAALRYRSCCSSSHSSISASCGSTSTGAGCGFGGIVKWARVQ
ncbi:hypothetical protein QYE76_057282 [Lolium multiflorum]|uniref:Uncharacterized protein n=1 Tax=Lolium multiflorum TaxID=4521 RepID=A0AAD8T4X9_LOLMU|nr:hypothetical protein QYE76_057282 [Lolium multiflorum]